MVLEASPWVKPAPALIFSESGEVRLFPPRNRGRLPRALTFGDQDCRQYAAEQEVLGAPEQPQVLSPFEFAQCQQMQEEQNSFLITSGSESMSRSFNVEDPPDEYTSFEREYSKHSIVAQEKNSHAYPFLNVEAPSMSTPTEQYIKNVLTRKKTPQQPSPLAAPSQQPHLSSVSDTGCLSPLLQPDSGPCLSLDDLVDLYAKKLEEARAAKGFKDLQANNESDVPTNEVLQEENRVANLVEMEQDNDNSSNEETLDCGSQDKRNVDICSRNPMQLMTFDIHMFLQKLDSIYPDQRKAQYQHQDWLCISTEELEVLLMNCCKETIKLVMME